MTIIQKGDRYFIKSLDNDDYFAYCASNVIRSVIRTFNIHVDYEQDAFQHAMLKAYKCRSRFNPDCDEFQCMAMVKVAVTRSMITFIKNNSKRFDSGIELTENYCCSETSIDDADISGSTIKYSEYKKIKY